MPSRQTRLGVTQNALTGKLKEFNTKQHLLSPMHGKVHVVQSSVRNWDGNRYLVLRWCNRILKIHKIVTDKSPSYLKNKLPRLRRPLYRQSSSNTFHEFKCKSLRYMSCFFPGAITSWNNVIAHLDDIPSFNVLKKHILSLTHQDFRKILQTNVITSLMHPYDKCLCNEGIEDTINFLFLCPSFSTRRATLAINVIAILQKYNLTHLGNQSYLYLYGHRTINFADNRKILLPTIEYIKETPPNPHYRETITVIFYHFFYFTPFCFYMYVNFVFTLFFYILLLCCNFLFAMALAKFHCQAMCFVISRRKTHKKCRVEGDEYTVE